MNLLLPGNVREGREIGADQVVTVSDDPDDVLAWLTLPDRSEDAVPPIEIIDGQHRLYAFSDGDPEVADFEVPVVAFHGLDFSWQAYLFWTINIKPKKINASLAFDLYPLLREQDWLEQGDKLLVYRESRAQELTEMLWSHPDSPWYQRINMLGGPRAESGPVTQAAFIRSLIASLVKSWIPAGRAHTGGLFGGTPDQNSGLGWSRVQQAAFLLDSWRKLAASVRLSDDEWALSARRTNPAETNDDFDAAFAGPHTLLATDQGVRGFQSVVNDLCYKRDSDLGLADWREGAPGTDLSATNVSAVAANLPSQISNWLQDIGDNLATFDWRSSSSPDLDPDQRVSKAALRGSGGYKGLKVQLIEHLSRHGTSDISDAAAELLANDPTYQL